MVFIYLHLLQLKIITLNHAVELIAYMLVKQCILIVLAINYGGAYYTSSNLKLKKFDQSVEFILYTLSRQHISADLANNQLAYITFAAV